MLLSEIPFYISLCWCSVKWFLLVKQDKSDAIQFWFWLHWKAAVVWLVFTHSPNQSWVICARQGFPKKPLLAFHCDLSNMASNCFRYCLRFIDQCFSFLITKPACIINNWWNIIMLILFTRFTHLHHVAAKPKPQVPDGFGDWRSPTGYCFKKQNHRGVGLWFTPVLTWVSV